MTGPATSPAPPPLPAATNTPGRIALGCGIGSVSIGLLAQLFSALVLPRLMEEMSVSPSGIWKLYLPFQLSTALLALLAIAFGAAGLGRDGPRLAAAAGTAIGAANLTSLLFGIAISIAARLFT